MLVRGEEFTAGGTGHSFKHTLPARTTTSVHDYMTRPRCTYRLYFRSESSTYAYIPDCVVCGYGDAHDEQAEESEHRLEDAPLAVGSAQEAGEEEDSRQRAQREAHFRDLVEELRLRRVADYCWLPHAE